jgi:hypothetical protein
MKNGAEPCRCDCAGPSTYNLCPVAMRICSYVRLELSSLHDHPNSASDTVIPVSFQTRPSDAQEDSATILQFVDYGIKFGNKVVAVYKNRSELAELRENICEYQQRSKVFQKDLQLRQSNLSSGETLLVKIAEDCHQTATDLVGLLGGFILKDEDKSWLNAFKIVAKGEAYWRNRADLNLCASNVTNN